MNDCAVSKFSKSLNPRNLDKSVSDILIRTRFLFEGSYWISVSGCKLTILPDIQPANQSCVHGVKSEISLSQKFRLTPVKFF